MPGPLGPGLQIDMMTSISRSDGLPTIHEHRIIMRSTERARIEVAMEQEDGTVRAAVIVAYGLPLGDMGVMIESNQDISRAVADIIGLARGLSGPLPLRRQHAQAFRNRD